MWSRCRRSLSSPSGDLSSHILIDLIRSFEISRTRIVFLYSDLFSSRGSFCWSLFSLSSNLIIYIVPVLNKIILVPRGVFRPGSYPAIRPSRLCWEQDAFQAPTAYTLGCCRSTLHSPHLSLSSNVFFLFLTDSSLLVLRAIVHIGRFILPCPDIISIGGNYYLGPCSHIVQTYSLFSPCSH